MSFLIDAPWLYALGRTYGRAEPDRAAVLGAATVAGFWAVSVPLYADADWTRPIWRLCRARSGRDWMVNSGVLRIDDRKLGRRTHLLAAVLFASYPLCLALGVRHARGRH